MLAVCFNKNTNEFIQVKTLFVGINQSKTIELHSGLMVTEWPPVLKRQL